MLILKFAVKKQWTKYLSELNEWAKRINEKQNDASSS